MGGLRTRTIHRQRAPDGDRHRDDPRSGGARPAAGHATGDRLPGYRDMGRPGVCPTHRLVGSARRGAAVTDWLVEKAILAFVIACVVVEAGFVFLIGAVLVMALFSR